MRNLARVAAWTLALGVMTGAWAAEDPAPPSEDEDAVAQPAEEEEKASVDDFEEFALSVLQQYAASWATQRSKIFEVKYFNPQDEGATGGWGVNYKWNAKKSSADMPRAPDDAPLVLSKLEYDLAADGSYAFGDATNNEDLSTIKAAVRLEHGNFGKRNRALLKKAKNTLDPENLKPGSAYQLCLRDIPAPTEDPVQREEVKRMFEACEEASAVDALVRSESSAYYYTLDFHGGLEGNQDYSDSHSLFGLTGVYFFEPSRAMASYNILDLPFRFLRDAFSTGESHYVAPYPSLLLSVDRLDASSDETRSALTTKDTYTRASAEVAFNTIVASVAGQAIRFNVSYRYFYEISAPEAIKAADLDAFDYLKASFRFPAQLLPMVETDDYELYVGYTMGKLPFDQDSDKAIELGITTNMKWLGELLAQ
jgi:hypothetical protein